MNDLVRNLGLLQKASELLASILNERNMLEGGMKVSKFRSHLGIQSVLRGERGDIKRVNELLQNRKHNWIICVNLDMVCFPQVRNADTPSIPAFCACGTAEP